MLPESRPLPDKHGETGIAAMGVIAPPEGGKSPAIRTRKDHDLPRRLWAVAAMIIAGVAIVYCALTFLKSEVPVAQSPQTAMHEEPAVLATGGNEEIGIVDPPAPADDLEPLSLWRNADATLEKFLAATHLAERMPLMETRATEEELAATCLAKPLPAVVRMVQDFRETNVLGDRVDCFYTVEFHTSNSQRRIQTILVRTLGEHPPKVMADAFLDTYVGRLAAYAANPSDQSAFFRAVVYAVADCTDTRIPNHDQKLTLRLLTSDTGQQIACASFSRNSMIAEILEDGGQKLAYGRSRPCTVVLRWNTVEDPARSFLEAIAIRDFGWDS